MCFAPPWDAAIFFFKKTIAVISAVFGVPALWRHNNKNKKAMWHCHILTANNISRPIPATLGELNAISCPGHEYHTGLLQISRNAIDATADLHNNNLSNTLHIDLHVSLEEFLADVNNSSLHDEVAPLMCLFPMCDICFSFLQLILAHQNFACVCNLYCGRHCITAFACLCLRRRSR